MWVLTSSSSNLDMEGVDPQFLAPRSDILSRQHSSIGRGFVSICLDFHSASNTGDGFTATGITQNVSLGNHIPRTGLLSFINQPEIGDVNKSIVEGGEDTRDTEDEFTWCKGSVLPLSEHGLGRLTLSGLRA